VQITFDPNDEQDATLVGIIVSGLRNLRNAQSAQPANEPATEKAAAPVSPAPAPVATTGEPEKPLTIDDVKRAVIELANTEGKGLPAVRALLDKFGFARAADVTPEKYAEVITAAQQAAVEK
jgi:hypothetical protein